MPEKVEIPLADLQLDPANPRLLEEPASQQGVYVALAKQLGRQLVNLAEDIVQSGLDPTTAISVIPTSDAKRRYRVLDGNRRVLALKALDTPSIVSGALSVVDQRKLTQLAERYADDPIDPVPCTLFDSEKEAGHWIELRHTGANEGVGLIEWDPNEKDRYRARHGGAKRNLAGQVLDFLSKVDAGAGPQPGQKIATSLQRLLTSPDVRDRLGLVMEKGQLSSRFPPAETVKGLAHVVEDLSSGKVKVLG